MKVLTNRVFLGVVVLLVAVGVWEFGFKPQYMPLFERGKAAYARGEYATAQRNFKAAYVIRPNELSVITSLGWTEYRLRNYNEAGALFHRALDLDDSNAGGIVGAAAVQLATSKVLPEVGPLERVLERNPDDADAIAVLADTRRQMGNNTTAAALYSRLRTFPGYRSTAEQALCELYGLETFDPALIAPKVQPTHHSDLRVSFRAADGAMWRLSADGQWQKFYVAGVNLGPAAPGYLVGAPPSDPKMYREWLRAAAEANANVVRAYTLLPPSFYRELKRTAETNPSLVLYQQVWIGDPEGKNLFQQQFMEDTRAEIRHVVDAIHGHGDIPQKNARGSGMYLVDVADQVGAILLGREVEPSVVIETNQRNPQRTQYKGMFVSVQDATATETWFAEMLDYLVAYETETYDMQHPVALVNWPPLDPLTHPTELPLEKEIDIRIARGEQLRRVTGINDDNDAVAIDEAKFSATAAYSAGLFASYHVYPYWPDFLINDPQYLKSRDPKGTNTTIAYLRELRARVKHPLVVTEFGVPTSIGISHFHPAGWHHGGHGETEQGEILARLYQSVRQAGCAGGIVFELIDEWYKYNWMTRPFEVPLERSALWLNELNPEKRYGLVGFRTSRWKLFAEPNGEWDGIPTLAAGVDPADRNLSLKASTDEAFVYFRLSGTDPKKAYAIAINTLPGRVGFKSVAGAEITNGANFVVVVDRAARSARLLVSENYNPYRAYPKATVPGEMDFGFRQPAALTFAPRGTFEQMRVVTNRDRYTRDAQRIPGKSYDRGVLRLGNPNPASPDFDSLAEWTMTASGDIVVRLSWGKLFVTDPSSHQVFFGFLDEENIRMATTPGISLAVVALDTANLEKARAVGWAPRQGESALLTWSGWNSVHPEMYLKKSYYALQKEFRNANVQANATSAYSR